MTSTSRPLSRKGKPPRGRAEAMDLVVPGDALPGGRDRAGGRGRVLAPKQRAFVIGAVILGAKNGGLRTCPQGWLERPTTLADLVESLQPLRELPVEMVLATHGELVLDDARGSKPCSAKRRP